MPRYQIQDTESGRTMVVEGEAPPSPADAAELFAGSAPAPAAPAAPGLFTRLAGKVAEGVQAENPEQIQDPVIKEGIMRVGTPMAAAALAPATGGLSLALGAAGALTGEVAAQASELQRGAREDPSYGRMVAAPIIAGTPLGPATGGTLFVKGALAAGKPLAPLVRGAAGGVVGGVASGIEQTIDKGTIDWAELGQSAAWQAAFGTVLGGIETVQATRAQQAALLGLRRRTQNWQGTDEEFLTWLRAKKAQAYGAAPAPAAPGASAAAPEAPPALAPAADRPAPAPSAEPMPPAPTAPLPTVAAPGAPVVAPTTSLTQGAVGQTGVHSPGLGGSTPPPASNLPALPISDLAAPQRGGGETPSPEILRVPPLAELPPLSPRELSVLEKMIVNASEAGIVSTDPAKPKGSRLRYGARADGQVDIIDAIHDLRGVPLPPKGEAGKGGEHDGFWSTFGTKATRILTSQKEGAIDVWLKDTLVPAYPQFAHLADNPDGFYATVIDTLRQRTQVKARMEKEQAAQRAEATRAERFNAHVLNAKTGTEINVDTLNQGTTFRRLDGQFTVTGIDEAGNVSIDGGPRYGTQIVPAGTVLRITPRSLRAPKATPPDENAAFDLAEPAPELTPKAFAAQVPGMASDGGAAPQSSGSPPSGPKRARVAVNIEKSAEVPRFDFSESGVVKVHAARYRVDEIKRIGLIRAAQKHFSGLPENTFVRVAHNKEDYAHLKNGTHRGSLNRREGTSENGLSVGFTTEIPAKYAYFVEGKIDSIGGDGEPVLDLASAKPVGGLLSYEQMRRKLDDLREKRLKQTGWTHEQVRSLLSAPTWQTIDPNFSRGGSAASPGFAAESGATGATATAGAPPRASPPEAADNADFTQLPIELPEAVQFMKQLGGGQYPKIRETIRGNALGVFKYREGQPDSGEVELRADIFNLVSQDEKRELLRQAVAYATALKQNDPKVNFKEAVQARFHELVREAEAKAFAAGPRRALATLLHEAGHWVDFLPEGTLARGNILGRLGGLKRHLNQFLPIYWAGFSDGPNPNERAQLRRQAEKDLHAQVQEVVETIRREEPVYREIPITPETITGILKTLGREEFPEFYDWFAQLDRKTKADVLRQAMKGIVDARAAKYSRREPTGETKITEETVTRKTGPAPTKEAITARYEELLREELKRRGLISEKDIRRELEDAIKWWRGIKEVTPYLKQSAELWADGLSIFFNNPAALAKRAPTFYRALMGWLEAKPAVMESYRQLQREIASGEIYKQRVANLRDMFERDETAGHALEVASTSRDWQHVRDTLRLLFDRQFGPIERRVRSAQKADAATKPAGDQVLSAVENYLYRATAWEAYLNELRGAVEEPLAAAGLTHMDMAEYMFHLRITRGLYQNLAAPLGWNTKASSERLAEMRATYGPRYAVLEQAQTALRALYERRVVSLLKQAAVLSPELEAAIDAEVFYAPFNKAREFTGGSTDAIEALVKMHYGSEAGGQIYGAVGNLGEIRNPYVQMQHRALGLITMAYRQIAIKQITGWLRQYDPMAWAPAEKKFNGRRLEVVRVDNPRVMTLFTLDNGVVNGHYVPRVIGEMFERGGALENMIVGLAHGALAPFKAVLTELNPGFWAVAFTKDVVGAAWQLPRGARFLTQLPRAAVAANATFSGKPDKLAQAALDRLAVISRADPRGEHLGHVDEMTRLLLRMGKSPAMWETEAGKIERALRKVWQVWTTRGQILERTVKIAALAHLDRQFPDLPEAEKIALVHEAGGSPNFLQKGRAAAVLELGTSMMFFNAWKESLRAQKRAQGRDPRGWWTKFLASAGLAAAALWAFESGAFDGGMSAEDAEDYRDQLRSIPERDKLRGFPIVLGWADKAQGKVAYLLLPLPDNMRWLHAIWRKMLQSGAGEDVGNAGLGSVLQYQGQDLPGQHPAIAEGKKWWAYWVEKRNPYDDFTGRGALNENAVQAREAGGELAAQTLSALTGGIVMRARPESRDAMPTELERFMRETPLVENILGRWLRVSNQGRAEQFRRDTLPTEQDQAHLRIIGDEMIQRAVAGQPLQQAHLSLLSESPYLAQYYTGALPHVLAGKDSQYVKALLNARTQAAQLAIIEAENRRAEAKAKRLNGGRPALPLPPPGPGPN